MSVKEIMAIAIKLMAISLIIGVVLHAPRLILTISTMERMYEDKFQPVFYISTVSLFLLIGVIASVVLYKVADSVLKSIPGPNESELILATEKFILQVAGVYFMVSTLQTLPSLAMAYSSSSSHFMSNLGGFIGYMLQLAVGLFMLVSPKVWAKLFHKLRGRA